MPVILMILLLLVGGSAQSAQNPSEAQSAPCDVQGVVLKADTGEPLRKAIVEVWQEEGQGGAIDAITDNMGRFDLKNLQPGRYRLSAEHPGYVRQEYGQTKPDGPGADLSLSSGQNVSGLTLSLTPAAVITGHVFDEDGDPVQGAQVSSLRYIYRNGQRELAHAGAARTNDLGEFRIFGLAPGQYILEADKKPQMLSALKAEAGFVPVYYPGVADVDRSTPIGVQAGEEFSSADITLQTAHTLTLRGHVASGIGGGPAYHAQVFLVSQGITSVTHVAAQTLVTNPQGLFELHNVTPGSYFIYAFLNEGGRGELARQPLEVTDGDLNGISLALASGVNLKGRLRIEGQLNSNLGAFRISLSPRNTRLFFAGVPGDTVKPDGSFLLENVFDDEYEINIDGLAPNDYLKSARLDGMDALTAGLTIDSRQTPGLLDLLVSPNGARVDGVVATENQAFPGASVTIIPDPPRRGVKRLFKSTNTDQFGHYVLQGIAPGDYKLFAWESIPTGAYKSADFLLPFENRGESVHITEGTSIAVPLELIPAKDTNQ